MKEAAGATTGSEEVGEENATESELEKPLDENTPHSSTSKPLMSDGVVSGGKATAKKSGELGERSPENDSAQVADEFEDDADGKVKRNTT